MPSFGNSLEDIHYKNSAREIKIKLNCFLQCLIFYCYTLIVFQLLTKLLICLASVHLNFARQLHVPGLKLEQSGFRKVRTSSK